MTWLTNLMIDASWAAVERSRSSSFVVFEDLDAVVIVQAHGLERVGADAQVFLDEAVDLRRGGDDRMHVQPGRQAQFIQAGVVEDSGSDDRDAVAVLGQRHQPAVQQNPGGELGQKLLGRGVLVARPFPDRRRGRRNTRPGERRIFSSGAPLTARRASSSGLPAAAASRTCAAFSASSRPSSISFARTSFTRAPFCGEGACRLEVGRPQLVRRVKIPNAASVEHSDRSTMTAS